MVSTFEYIRVAFLNIYSNGLVNLTTDIRTKFVIVKPGGSSSPSTAVEN